MAAAASRRAAAAPEGSSPSPGEVHETPVAAQDGEAVIEGKGIHCALCASRIIGSVYMMKDSAFCSPLHRRMSALTESSKRKLLHLLASTAPHRNVGRTEGDRGTPNASCESEPPSRALHDADDDDVSRTRKLARRASTLSLPTEERNKSARRDC